MHILHMEKLKAMEKHALSDIEVNKIISTKVNEDLWKKLKKVAIDKDEKPGVLLSRAMDLYLKKAV
jgi:hypothetical protein